MRAANTTVPDCTCGWKSSAWKISHRNNGEELQREQLRGRPVRLSSRLYKAREWINTEIMRNRFQILVYATFPHMYL